MAISVEVDMDANAVYVRLGDGPVASTAEVSSSVLVDLDAMGVVIGVELLSVSASLDVNALVKQFHVRDEAATFLRTLPEILASTSMRSGADGTMQPQTPTRTDRTPALA